MHVYAGVNIFPIEVTVYMTQDGVMKWMYSSRNVVV